MGTQYLIDSNAVTEFLGGILPSSASNQLQDIVNLNTHHLFIINQIELLGFDSPTAEMQTLEAFIASCNVLPLSDAVVQKTIELRKAYKIKLPDAVIAATALVFSLRACRLVLCLPKQVPVLSLPKSPPFDHSKVAPNSGVFWSNSFLRKLRN